MSSVAPYLPPELLLKILGTSDRPTLLSSSLVSRSYRAPSQYLLESRLSLPTSKVARTWLNCPGRRTRTRRLSLGAGLSREEAERVFETVEGLEELKVVQDPMRPRDKFDARALQAKELKDLFFLRLNTPLVDSSASSPLTLPFSLHTLRCKGLYSAFPPHIISAIVASSLSTLISLDLDCYGSNSSAEPFVAALYPLKDTITSIELHGTDRYTPALFDFLSSCTVLETFFCWEATSSLLASLPSSVKTLSIGLNYTQASSASYEELLVESGLLRQLDTLRFGGISSATLKSQVGGEELLQQCEERGIRVEHGVEVTGRYGTLSFGFPVLGKGSRKI
ncbi:hypothetical protein JCM8547_007359 [Rhodosporidiobolus lusitaniae]